MIDTIVLRIHNIKDYPQLKSQFYAPKQRSNAFVKASVDETTGEVLETAFNTQYVFMDTGRFINPVIRSTVYIPSSHYELSYRYDEERNYLEFNFSIPKYKFGTNIIQFINQYDQSALACYNEFILFIHNFLRTQLLQTPKLYDVEINRIDLCYNQMFNSKSDALLYLDEQKKLLAKYARSSGNNKHSYDTSWVYVTRRYSFKCYHKGTEFQKNDLKKLMKRNPLNYDLPYLIEHSDRMLRYEMTVRSSFLNYLFRQAFFESQIHGESLIYKNHLVSKYWKRLASLSPFELDGEKRKQVEIYNNYSRTSKFFCLSSVYKEFDFTEFALAMRGHNSALSLRQHQKVFNFNDTVTFDFEIFNLIFQQFWQLLHKYQFDQVVDLSVIKSKIDKLEMDKIERKKLGIKGNYKYNSNFDDAKMLLCSMVINSGGKISDLKKFLPRATFFKLQGQLKILGITDQNTSLTIPKPRTDYLDYLIYFKQFHKYGC
jgi:hypothetical protein